MWEMVFTGLEASGSARKTWMDGCVNGCENTTVGSLLDKGFVDMSG